MTLTELTTISNPEYLFEFTEEQSSESVYAILTNESLSTTRYDEFTVIDGTDLDFPIDGFYTYNVYEQANGSGNLDPTGLNRVETGRSHVYVIDTAPNEYTDSTETENVYE
tara:strand:+ start:2792 stop:3124 length:333 start_codon:yes stop_codon:yes gene_type:complete